MPKLLLKTKAIFSFGLQFLTKALIFPRHTFTFSELEMFRCISRSESSQSVFSVVLQKFLFFLSFFLSFFFSFFVYELKNVKKIYKLFCYCGADDMGASSSISSDGGFSEKSVSDVILSALYQTMTSTKKATSISAPVVPATAIQFSNYL